MKSITKLYIIVSVVALLSGCFRGKPSYRSYDIFDGTPGHELAKAVESNNLKKIEKLIIEDSVDINYQDPIYKQTVLTTATMNTSRSLFPTKLSTIEKLLELGADPNLYANWDGDRSNSVTIACSGDDADLLALLLKYGGDPNSVDKSDLCGELTALMLAARLRIHDDYRCLRMLIEHGADVNATTSSYRGGAIEAAWHEYMSILILIQNGADPFTTIYPKSYLNEPQMSFPEYMRYDTQPLDSKQYKYKMMLKKWLKDNDIFDYDTIPIPEEAIEDAKKYYPDTWEEYLKVY